MAAAAAAGAVRGVLRAAAEGALAAVGALVPWQPLMWCSSASGWNVLAHVGHLARLA